MGQGAYIFGCVGPRLRAEEADFFKEAEPWGFILFARNVENPEQLRRLTRDLRACIGRDAPILIDQEGGRVQRMRAPHWREWMPALDQIEKAGENAARSMWLRYRLIAEELKAVGIDANCAPLGDTLTAQTHPVLANRCYGSELDSVVEVSRVVANGLISGGVLPVVKHLPGHGRAMVDSHLDLPRVNASAQELQNTDFAVFKALADLPLAMTAHIVYSDLDELPATQSPKIIAMIREKIGFSGLLMTDDISMQALGGLLEDRCLKSIDAGCDMILHCNGDLAEMQRVVGVAGQMSDVSQNRADNALKSCVEALPFDIPAAEAELEAIMRGSPYV